MPPLYKRALTGCIGLLLAAQALTFYMIGNLATRNPSQAFMEAGQKADMATVIIDTKVTMGAGIIISNKGYILTCAHVVASAADGKVNVIFFDDKKVVTGLVIWQDPERDLALVKVKQKNLSARFQVLPLALEDPQVGEQILTIGHPLGNYWTVAQGVVSKYNFGSLSPLFNTKVRFLQTDALMHPGSSGGPVVNLEGQLVGICDRVATERAPIYVPLFIDDAVAVSSIHSFLRDLPTQIAQALNIS